MTLKKNQKMTKEQLQQEIKSKVKPGVKPSDLRKLKRSKSEGDIPKAPLLPQEVPLNRSKSTEPFQDEKYPYTTLISQQEELDKLRKETTAKSETIKLLRNKIADLEQNNPPTQLLTDQLQTKQQELEGLRKKLEITSSELNTLKENHSALLDDNLTLKHQNLKDWWQQYEQTQELETELKNQVDYASDELLEQDKVIEKLRKENSQLKLTNQSLEKDLNLAEKLAELRKDNFSPTSHESYWKPIFFGLVAIWFIFTLNSAWKSNFKE